MCGDSVFLGDHSGDLANFIRAISGLEQLGLPRHALIGGLAVIARLAQRHRATADIDEVYLGDDTDVIQLLVDQGADRQANGVILASGEKVDLIAVGDYRADELPDDTGQRAFILSHRWALDGATLLNLVVTDRSGGVRAEATTPVASIEALVAMKLASASARREPALNKRASDIFDVYRLLAVHDADRSVSRAERAAPDDLAILVRNLANMLLVEEAERSTRWLITMGGPEMDHISADDLRSVGVPFRDELDSEQ